MKFSIIFLLFLNSLMNSAAFTYTTVDKSLRPDLSFALFDWLETQIVEKENPITTFELKNHKFNLHEQSPQMIEHAKLKLQELIKNKELRLKQKAQQEKEDAIYRKHLAARISSSMKNDFLTMRY